MAEYGSFTLSCLVISFYVLTKEGFDVLHAHNPPDTLFLVALPYKLMGKKFVFDHHDLSRNSINPVMEPKTAFIPGCCGCSRRAAWDWPTSQLLPTNPTSRCR